MKRFWTESRSRQRIRYIPGALTREAALALAIAYPTRRGQGSPEKAFSARVGRNSVAAAENLGCRRVAA